MNSMADSSCTTTLIDLRISDSSTDSGRQLVPVVAERESKEKKPVSHALLTMSVHDHELAVADHNSVHLSSLLMMSDSSPITNLPQFSVDGYRFWKFRIRIFLKAKHAKIWETVQYGPTPESQMADQLDNYAMLVISSTVGDLYLPKIINCNTAKEMWDALAALGEGSDEIQDIKCDLACQKLDSFVQLKNESILMMELRFTAILVDIETRRKGRYSQREINWKVLDALSNEWELYRILHLCRDDLNELPTDKLFSMLKANEYTINRKSSSSKPTKNVAL